MRIDTDGRLLLATSPEDRVEQVLCTRYRHLDVPNAIGPLWHCTEVKEDGPTLAQHLLRPIPPDQAHKAVSWHFTVCRDGLVIQNLRVDVGGWHCPSPGTVGGVHFASANHYMLGIELEGLGRLRRDDAGAFYCWPYYQQHPNNGPVDKALGFDPRFHVDADRAQLVAAGPWPTASHGWWDTYTPQQVEVAEDLLRALVDHFGWKRDVCGTGHTNLDPVNKEDPGPLWLFQHLPGILDHVFQPAG